MEPIIEFKDFSFKYRAQTEPTLRDINLKIMPGEKVLIVGPSGSGKSTLAHCINGLVPFSYTGDITGSLKVAGKDPASLGLFGLSKIVGTVLQDTDGQFIGLTVAEDIAFALENDMVPQEEMFARVDEAAEMVDVKPLLKNAQIKRIGEKEKRPMVEMEVRMGKDTFRANFTIAERAKFEYQTLVGRNVLYGRAIVDVTLSNTLK